MFDENKKCSTNLTKKRVSLRINSKYIYKILKFALISTLVCIFLVSCKAQSSLEVSMDSNSVNSGEFKLKIVLDDEAASIIRGDAYKPIDIKTIFHSSDLKKLGFNVSQNKNTIEISRSFDSETELKKILSVMIGSQTYDLRINRQTSILNQKRSILIDINLNKLRDIYLKDENVKKHYLIMESNSLIMKI